MTFPRINRIKLAYIRWYRFFFLLGGDCERRGCFIFALNYYLVTDVKYIKTISYMCVCVCVKVIYIYIEHFRLYEVISNTHKSIYTLVLFLGKHSNEFLLHIIGQRLFDGNIQLVVRKQLSNLCRMWLWYSPLQNLLVLPVLFFTRHRMNEAKKSFLHSCVVLFILHLIASFSKRHNAASVLQFYRYFKGKCLHEFHLVSPI